MSDSTFVSVVGICQSFGDAPVVSDRETSAGTIKEFTIRTPAQLLVRVSVFPEYQQAIESLSAGDGVYADGAYQERQVGDKTYRNLTARTLAITPVAPRVAAPSRSKRAAKASF